MKNLGAVFPGSQDVWIHPVLRKPEQFVTLSATLVHELGGHFSDHNGASGNFLAALTLFGSKSVFRLLDPFSLFTTPLLYSIDEGASFGTEWELAHRIPLHLREQWMTKIRKAMGEHAVLLEMKSRSERDRYKKKHFSEDDWLKIHFMSLYLEYITLENASLSKQDFVRRFREIHFNGFWGTFIKDFIRAEDTKAMVIAFLHKTRGLIKFGATVAAGVSVFT